MSLPLKDVSTSSDNAKDLSGGSTSPVNPNEDKKIAYGVIALALVVVVVLVWRFIKRKSKKDDTKKEDDTN